MKRLLTVFALATLVTTPAFAAKKHQTTLSEQGTWAQAYVPYDQHEYYPVDGYTAISYGKVVGRDPDPNIRLMLIRDTITNAP